MTARFFVDTNLLVYARDSSDGLKQERAESWMKRLWLERSGALSFQVLSEFYVTVTRKLQVPPALARADVVRLLAWNPVQVDDRVLQSAWELEEQHSLSWWDALIVSAARVSGCELLLTEDMQSGQVLGGVRVVNPFTTPPEV